MHLASVPFSLTPMTQNNISSTPSMQLVHMDGLSKVACPEQFVKVQLLNVDKYMVCVAEQLRCRIGMKEVLGLIPVTGTAYTCSQQPPQTSILSVLVNITCSQDVCSRMSLWGHPSHRSTSAYLSGCHYSTYFNK